MSLETIKLRDAQLTIHDGVAVFSHERPAARNALSMDMRDDYQDMLSRVQSDSGIRVLVITGSGGSFCAGGDLKSLKENQSGASLNLANDLRRRIQAGHRWMEQVRSLEIPVIAAVDGPAVGAGFSIALAADFILASTRAVFCMSFAKVGLVPDLGALHFLPRAVGLSMAKELVFTARRVSAAEGKELGFVHSIHEPEALQSATIELARRFFAGPREAFGLAKGMLNKSYETDYATLAEIEAQAQALASVAPYHAKAIASFLHGEPAAFDWDRQQA